MEGSESIEGMSSRRLKLLKSKSVDLAFALPVMQLEFILNHHETLVKEERPVIDPEESKDLKTF
jgi:hypothetical protein